MSITIQEKVNTLAAAKEAIKTSLINKGITVNPSDTFRSYADKINNLPQGLEVPEGMVGSIEEMEPNTTSLTSRFSARDKIVQLDLSSWDTSQVTSMSSMFSYCYALTTLDLSNFDTSNVTDMSSMFLYCYALTNLTLGPNWASNEKITYFDLSECPLTHESALDVLNKLADRNGEETAPILNLGDSVIDSLTDDEKAIATNKGWSVDW